MCIFAAYKGAKLTERCINFQTKKTAPFIYE